MADGEISVNVRADGVDEAAEDVADEGGVGMGGGDGGGEGRVGGLAQSIKGGIVGGLVASLLGPLLDVFEPFVKILQAFVAPLAQVLLRLFTPVLRFLIQLLPAWFDFVDENEGLVGELLMALSPLVTILSYLPSIARGVSNFAENKGLVDALKAAVSPLTLVLRAIARAIGAEVQEATESTGPRTAGGEPSFPGGANGRPADTQSPVSIAISGGLTPFIDLITANRNIDFDE
jgi:hypothetical protein